MVAIITGTISPSEQMRQLVLKNTEERLKQYIDALEFLIREKAFPKIIFCDNSGYSMENFHFLMTLAAANDTKLELLSFEGNSLQCIRHGKGYGEGEIMEYIFSHSRLLESESFFVKLTGRLKVTNIRKIVDRLKDNRCYFNIPKPTIRDYYDTRLYAMPVSVFRDAFLCAYDQVWDDQGMYLEKVYTKILIERGIKVCNFPRFPRIIGLGGSAGLIYTYTEWKCRIKDILSLLGRYKIRD